MYANTLQQLAAILQTRHNFTEEPGLLYGHTGMSLFLFYYAAQTGNKTAGDTAQELLLSAYKEAVKKDKRDVRHDIPGIGWFFSHLVRYRLIEIDADELLDSVDTFVFDGIQHRFSHVLGAGGLLSKGSYLVARYHSTTSGYKKVMISEVIASVVDEIKTKFRQGWPDTIGKTYDRYYSNSPLVAWQHKTNSIAAVFYFLTTVTPLQIYLPIVRRLMEETAGYLRNLCLREYPITAGQDATRSSYTSLLRIYHALHTGGNNYLGDLDETLITKLEQLPPADKNTAPALKGSYQPAMLYKLLSMMAIRQPDSNQWKELAIAVQEQQLLQIRKQLPTVPNLGLQQGIAGTGLVLLEALTAQPIPWEDVLLLQGD
ncbi:hypothetical protein KTO58_12000 [Chitinophaga pendula]|uniref:hypothetical protein n=1 Tax=Chitinophaga TaxID=79328 RepID=UPI000BAF8734|nr:MULTISPECIES: hypothetical protein [Chitinophaga]ASZ12513.1 hypothetical protein CK934_16885 [Chitinophaga sp. MD30]UCJ09884.1 hypothetical protein KTO58_12000 [Chitinophaga pendula]